MEHRKELFKANGTVLSPRNHKILNAKIQQIDRAENRNTIYNQTRNISSSPKFDDFKIRAAVSSTPMVKSHQPVKENGTKENFAPEEITETTQIGKTVSESKAERKLSRHEAHIQRFLAWKAEKLRQKELEKLRAKPPFIPVGKPKQNSALSQQQYSFAPKNHVFRPPAGLKDPTQKEADRQSIYVPVALTPRHMIPNDSKLTSSGDSRDFKKQLSTKSAIASKGLNIANREPCNEAKKTGLASSLESAAKFAKTYPPKGTPLNYNYPPNAFQYKPCMCNKPYGVNSTNVIGEKPKTMPTSYPVCQFGPYMTLLKPHGITSKTLVTMGQWQGNGFTKSSTESDPNRILNVEARKTSNGFSKSSTESDPNRILNAEARKISNGFTKSSTESDPNRILNAEARKTSNGFSKSSTESDPNRILNAEARKTSNGFTKSSTESDPNRILNAEARKIPNGVSKSSTESDPNRILNAEARKTSNGFSKCSTESDPKRILNAEARKTSKLENISNNVKTSALGSNYLQYKIGHHPKLDNKAKSSTNYISAGSRPQVSSSKQDCGTNKGNVAQTAQGVPVPVSSSSYQLQENSCQQSQPSTSNLKETKDPYLIEAMPKIALSKAEGLAKPPLVKPVNVPAGAVGKAKIMQERKQVPPTHSVKPNLGVILKAKKQKNSCKLNSEVVKKVCKHKFEMHQKEAINKIVSEKTPSEVNNSEKVFTFVTSTQMKPKSVSSLSTSGFSELFTTISPVEPNNAPTSHSKSGPSVSAKRALLQENQEENKCTKKGKFNFVRKVTVDDTVLDSPMLAPTSVVHEQPKNKETMENMPKISSGSQRTDSSSKNQGNVSVATRIIKKLQQEVLEKPVNLESPSKSNPPTKRLSKVEDNETTKAKNMNSLNHEFSIKKGFATEDSRKGKGPVLRERETDEQKNEVPKPKTSPELVTPTKTAGNSERPINYLSPFVSVSRGKVSFRKENEKRNSIYLQETPTKCVVPVQHVETPVEKRRALEAVRYFRQQLTAETQRLLDFCDQWSTYKEEQKDVLQANGGEDMINATIGQTRLLMTKKFMQFNSLIDRCEAQAFKTGHTDNGSEATKTITPLDLEGFWSMLSLQVENIEKRVKNLERWKANGWEDPDAVPLNPRPKKKPMGVTKKIIKTDCTKKPLGNTALRQMMRKMRQEKRANPVGQANTPEAEEKLIFVRKPSSHSPHRLRRSMSMNQTLRCHSRSNTPGRINIVVPDRRSRSIARTIISVPSPVNYSPFTVKAAKTALQKSLTNLQELTENNNLLKTALIASSHCKTPLKATNTPLAVKNQPMNSSPCTPKTTTQNVRKSILKTPGTGTNRLRNVVFNDHLSVMKFRTLSYDENDQSTQVEAVQQIHISDFHSICKPPSEISPTGNSCNEPDELAYCLRNRRVKLRPSCEIEIPK